MCIRDSHNKRLICLYQLLFMLDRRLSVREWVRNGCAEAGKATPPVGKQARKAYNVLRRLVGARRGEP